MASVPGSEISTDGPVLSLITKKLRALKKKYNRIVQLEESQAQGKTLNKEQEDLLKSKPALSVLIDEYEKLRQPLSSALQEELSRLPAPPQTTESEEEPKASPDAAAAAEAPSGDLEDLLRLLYFGYLFDVKSQQEFTSIMLTRTHERGCCLTYDYVTDDAMDLLGETDLDMISALGGLLTSRPVYAGVSHKNALEGCIQRAKLWLQEADEPIFPGASVTYAGLREKLNKIMALDYFTMTPEMKAPVDVAAAVGKYNSQMQVPEAAPAQDDFQVDGAPVHYQPQEDNQEEFQAVEVSIDQSSPVDETENVDEVSGAIASGDSNTGYQDQDQERIEADSEINQRDSEHKEQQQYIPRRPYQNQKSVRGGGGGGGGTRRGYSNGRGGRGGRGGAGGGGYQNGRLQQYYDPGFYPRNYYNTRGRGGGRSGGSGMYSNGHGGAAAHGGQVELHANS